MELPCFTRRDSDLTHHETTLENLFSSLIFWTHEGTWWQSWAEGGGWQNSNLSVHAVLCLAQPTISEVVLLEIVREQTTGLLKISLPA